MKWIKSIVLNMMLIIMLLIVLSIMYNNLDEKITIEENTIRDSNSTKPIIQLKE